MSALIINLLMTPYCAEVSSWLINIKPWIDLLFPASVVLLGIFQIKYSIKISKNMMLNEKAHRIKSVTPLITTGVDMLYKGENGEYFPAILNLSNVGLGPALIAKIQYSYSGQVYDNIAVILKESGIFNFDLMVSAKSFFWTFPEFYIGPNKDVTLFQMYFDTKDSDEIRPILIAFLKEVEIVFSYQGIYKEDMFHVRTSIIGKDFNDILIYD